MNFQEWRNTSTYRTESDYITFESEYGPIYEYEAGYIEVDLLGGFLVALSQSVDRFDTLADAEAFLWREWCESELNG
jgi:hypothetical protein